jgi:uncharacterized membrane protein YczE
MEDVFSVSAFFATFRTGGIPITFIVINLVQIVKGYSPNKKVTRLISILFGIVIGLAYWLAANPTPTTFAGWFTAVIFGLALGIFASKTFDTAVDAGAAAHVKAIESIDAVAAVQVSERSAQARPTAAAGPGKGKNLTDA